MKEIQQNHIKSGEYFVQRKKIKRSLILIIKLVFSGVAIVYVLKRISLVDIADIVKSAYSLYLAFAFLLFVASKAVAAFRTFLILKLYDIPISQWDNMKLYWTGMFYNLFLPGGIGGDVYKTVVINRMHSNGIKVSGGAILMDRVSGVTALIILALLFIPFIDPNDLYGWVTFVGIPAALAGFIAAILIFTPRLKEIIGKLIAWSFLVQILQVLSVFFILMAFHINAQQGAYLFIFLVSSIAAMLPISIGGIGIRELVFFSGSKYLLLDQGIAVTVSLSFYVISAIVSLFGVITALENRKNR